MNETARYIWLGDGMRRIADLPFVQHEFRRAGELLDLMAHRYDTEERGPISVEQLAQELKFDANAIRRAAFVLMMEFPNCLYPVTSRGEGIPETIRPLEPIWHASHEKLVNGPPKPDPVPVSPAPVTSMKVEAMPTSPNDNRKRVFVIQGRNAAANVAMSQFLRALGLKPTEFVELVARTDGSPYVGAALRKGIDEAQAVIAMFTPDEEAFLRVGTGPRDTAADQHRWQARPNVLFEAGMAMGMAESKTILVTVGADVSLFSDTDGRHCVRMDNSAPRRQELKLRLEKRLCDIDDKGVDWLSAAAGGDFEGCLQTPAQAVPAVAPTSPHASSTAVLTVTMSDEGRIPRLKRWLKQKPDHLIWDIPIECTEIEREAGVPADSADRLAAKWVEAPWKVKEREGGFITLIRGPEMVTEHQSPFDGGDY
jgi:predicted nucleotide-binding protein